MLLSAAVRLAKSLCTFGSTPSAQQKSISPSPGGCRAPARGAQPHRQLGAPQERLRPAPQIKYLGVPHLLFYTTAFKFRAKPSSFSSFCSKPFERGEHKRCNTPLTPQLCPVSTGGTPQLRGG